MSATLLLHTSNLEVLIRDHKMSPHLLQSLARNGVDSQFPLTLGEAEPELAPGGVAGPLAEELGHGGAAVAGSERGLVAVEWRVATRGCLGRHL